MSMYMAKIHPSVLCANHGDIKGEILKLEKAGVDYFHIDVMDGNFVPNFGCGTEIIKTIKQTTNIPMDVHLMVVDPMRHIKLFYDLGAAVIIIHPEADKHAARTLAAIKEMGAVPGIAINPGTSIETIKELLPICGHVLAMTVNPGFAGQAFLEYTVGKIQKLGELSKQFGFTLCVDGNINIEKVQFLLPFGVTNFVIGTALFQDNYSEMINTIKVL